MTDPNSKPDEIALIREVSEDFRERSLPYVRGDFAKLLYLSSCRDYYSGKYRHDGLADRFSEPAVHEALAQCHHDVFERLLQSPLAIWVDELRCYFKGSSQGALKVWKELQPYQTAVPFGTATLEAELFISNLKIALEILESEHTRR